MGYLNDSESLFPKYEILKIQGVSEKIKKKHKYNSDPICDSSAFSLVKDNIKFVGGIEDFPILESYCESTDLIMSSYSDRNKIKCSCIHFFADDRTFEYALTKNLDKTTNKISDYVLIDPDFSMFRDKDRAFNVSQIRKSRLVTAIWQKLGIKTIPVVSYSDADSFDYCFDGLPKHSVLATCGTGKIVKSERNLFIMFLKEVVRRLEPISILIYGPYIDVSDIGVEIKFIFDHITAKFRPTKPINKFLTQNSNITSSIRTA